MRDINIVYNETLNYLFSQLPMYQRQGKAAYKDNLENTLALDTHFKHPHTHFKTIHIAGTNGKGSVSHILASIFQNAGFKTGLYTSPHLIDFRERIKINGKKITKEFVVDFVANHKIYFEKLSPSFFELTVAMAFDYFANEKIDIAIVEVGMGGRLDSTNIIQPELSIITNIGFDHIQFLGKTYADIAAEKAGIIKKNTPIVIGEFLQETKPIFEQIATQKNSPIYFAQEQFSVDFSLQNISETQTIHVLDKLNNEKQSYELELLGHYQHKNLVTVLSALEILKTKFALNKDSILSGLKTVVQSTGLLGRWQIIDRNPLTICDTAHNTEGLKETMNQIKQYPFKNLHIIFGVVNDKSLDSLLKLLPQEAKYYFTKASIPRALDENNLYQKAKQAGLSGSTYQTVKQAFYTAKENALSEDFIYIGGSTFIVADLLAYLKTHEK